jgi:hypothetical protein
MVIASIIIDGGSKRFLRLCFQNKTPLFGVRMQVSQYQLLYPIRDEFRCAIFPFDPVNNGNRGSLSAFLKWTLM